MNTDMQKADKTTIITSALRRSTLFDLIVAVLVADMGPDRFDQVLELFGNLDLSGEERAEAVDELLGRTRILYDLMPSEVDNKAEDLVGALGKLDLAQLGKDTEKLNGRDIFDLMLLRKVGVDEAQTIINSISDRVSVKAAEDAADSVRDTLKVLDERPEDQLIEFVRNELDPELQGMTRGQFPRRGKGLGALGGLLGLFGALGAPGMESLDDLLGSLGQTGPVRVVRLVEPLGGGVGDLLRGPTVGDAWQTKKVAWGLPDSIANYFQKNPEASAAINMDRVRSTPLWMLKDRKAMESAFRRRSARGELLLEVYDLVVESIEQLYGSLDAAINQVKPATAAPANERKFVTPTPGCDCEGCTLLKTLNGLGINIDEETGEPVRDSAL